MRKPLGAPLLQTVNGLPGKRRGSRPIIRPTGPFIASVANAAHEPLAHFTAAFTMRSALPMGSTPAGTP